MTVKLNMEIRPRSKARQEVYPTKRTMNLYFRQDRTSAPATAVLYILFALAVLLALGKLAIYDPWAETTALEEQAAALEARNAAQIEQLQDYNQVLQDYLRVLPTQQEEALVDRMEILNLIDRVVRPAAQITKLSIQEDKVLLTFSGVTLSRAAELVRQLEQADFVSATSVDTATSGQEEGDQATVTVFFTVTTGEEQEETP